MNIIKYLSEKIKKGFKKIKLYTATAILTVTAATVGTLTACTNKTNDDNSNEPTKVVTEIPEITVTPAIEPTPVVEEEKEEEPQTFSSAEPNFMYNEPYFWTIYSTNEDPSDTNIKFPYNKSILDTNYDRITRLSKSDIERHGLSHISEFNANYSLLDFAKYLGEVGDKTVKYSDVYLALENNKNLTEDDKNIIRFGIAGLEKSFGDSLNLSALRINIENLKIARVDSKDDWLYSFMPDTSVVYININKHSDQEAIIKGSVCCGSITAYSRDGKNILGSIIEYSYFKDNIKNKTEIVKLGEKNEEAIIEVLFSKITSTPIEYNGFNRRYFKHYEDIEILNMLINLGRIYLTEYPNFGLTDYINLGYTGFVNKLIEKGVNRNIIRTLPDIDTETFCDFMPIYQTQDKKTNFGTMNEKLSHAYDIMLIYMYDSANKAIASGNIDLEANEDIGILRRAGYELLQDNIGVSKEKIDDKQVVCFNTLNNSVNMFVNDYVSKKRNNSMKK